jgi:hypothetical protein
LEPTIQGLFSHISAKVYLLPEPNPHMLLEVATKSSALLCFALREMMEISLFWI